MPKIMEIIEKETKGKSYHTYKYSYDNYSDWSNHTGGTLTDLSDPAANATYFKTTYNYYYWYKN